MLDEMRKPALIRALIDRTRIHDEIKNGGIFRHGIF